MYIKLLAFLLGFLITLLIINYLSVERIKKETFEVSSTPSASAPAPTPASAPAPAPTSAPAPTPAPDVMDAKYIPNKANKFMCINTFNDIGLISNIEKRWYECDLDKTKTNLITENINHYFTYNNEIKLIPNEINIKGSSGGSLSSTQLNGPKSFYFATNRDTFEVTEFSVIFCAKIRDVSGQNNIIFEMTGNTETINPQTLEYSASIINLNLIKNINNNFDVSFTIGNVVYKGLINNIDKNIILNNDFIIMSLVYTTTEINFYLNKQKFTYKNTESFRVKLGSAPVIINKGGTINMDLYSFIYYKSSISSDEMFKFSKYGNYYLSGLDFTTTQCQTTQQISPLAQQSLLLENRLKELEDNYLKALQKKVEDAKKISDVKFLDIKPLDLNYDENNLGAKHSRDKTRLGVKLENIKQSYTNPFFRWLF